MKIRSVNGMSLPPGKGGSPSDTFDSSTATYEIDGATKTMTVTYVRYFARQLAAEGIYDEEQSGIPVNQLASVLFLEKYPNEQLGRQYFNDFAKFKTLFEGVTAEAFRAKYKEVVFT